MATSGYVDTGKYSSRYYRVAWERTATDVANNTSTIKWTLSARGGSGWYAERTLKVVINGTTVFSKTSRKERYAETIDSGTIKIKHNTDGSKSFTIDIAAAVYVSSVNCTGGKTFALTAIPRAAKLSSAVNFNDETTNPSITYSNSAGSAVDTLQAYIYAKDDSTVLVGARDLSKTGTSFTFNDITSAEYTKLRNACGNSSSTTVKYYIKTVIGSNTFWSSAIDKTFTIVNANPTISCSAYDIKPESIALTGDSSKVIKGYNEIEAKMTATAKKGATIKETEIFCGTTGLPGDSSGVSGSFFNAKTGTVSFAAQDNRGFKTTTTINLTLIDYVTLTNSFKLRMSAEGVISITAEGDYFNKSFGAVKNTLNLYYRYMAEDDENYSSWIPITDITLNGNKYSATATIEGLDYQKTYVVQTKAVDKIRSVTPAAQKINAFPVFDWGEKDFNFNVPIMMNSNTVLRHNKDANNIVLSSSGGNIYIRPKGTDDTEGEIRITSTGDIIIGGKSLKSLLGI